MQSFNSSNEEFQKKIIVIKFINTQTNLYLDILNNTFLLTDFTDFSIRIHIRQKCKT